ncbi:uncharacterized protein Z519_08085 [Cladophialophora bantiana CBS 173.52]|uniref:Unplaced genomic scaffold supercont1.12, whole genome shotgun sequence n=1 Tax=Cladophialophora bantiana (strain ATCC 10958 / CBS 173.52 / CDC B-1940 / NIH 8579) TaxID=1442370 RepID=A0A0D2HKA1_CLAB1|nr:uncharacterized protein Z519_08085 [Cladophialophora bantiana CBS 173.52]KIW91190.1 hypothetical protein Z519_08085 [Cladophialophora bantiana CBS 173.52]
MPSTKRAKHREYARTGCKTCKCVPLSSYRIHISNAIPERAALAYPSHAKPMVVYITNHSRRIRKVKCDETKPQCHRCQRSGRNCDGYVDIVTQHQNTKSFKFVNYISHGPSFGACLFLQDTRQRQAFEFYQLRSSLELSGPFREETDVWNRLVLQAAYHETAIRHAVCALASFHQEYEDENLYASSFLRTGLEQYSYALKALVAAKGSCRCMEVTLIACIVFTFCEHLQGHLGSAKAHVHSGLKLLDAYVTLSREVNSAGPAHSDHYRPYFPLTILIILFRRLDRQLAEFGQQPVRAAHHSLRFQPPYLPGRFQSVAAATASLENIVDQLIGVTQEATVRQLDKCSSEMAALRGTWYVRLSQQLDQWKRAFDGLSSLDSTGNQDQGNHYNEAVLTLRLWYLSCRLFLLLDSPNEVMDYDECMPIFQSMVDVAQGLLEVQNKCEPKSIIPTPQKRKKASAPIIEAFRVPKSKCEPCELQGLGGDFATLRPVYFSRFPMLNKAVFTCTALSPVPPLFIVVTRCREPKVRRQALQILSQLNRRDGFWDSTLAAMCAGALLYSEELDTTDLHDQRGKAQVLKKAGSTKQIPVGARMLGVRPQFGEGRLLTFEFVRAQSRLEILRR